METCLSKKDYMKAIRRTNTVLRRELRKNTAEQDLDLIRECVESLSYYRRRVNELAAQNKLNASEPARLRPHAWQRAVLTSIAIVCVLALGVTAAQSAGWRIWDAVIKWDAGYLQVDYKPKATSHPTHESPWVFVPENSVFSSYDDFVKAITKYGIAVPPRQWVSRLLFSDGAVTYDVQRGSVSCNYYSANFSAALNVYTEFNAGNVISVGLGPSASTNREVNESMIDGVCVMWHISQGMFYATWQRGASVYALTTNARVGDVRAALSPFISG